MSAFEERLQDFIRSEENVIYFGGHPSDERAILHEIADRLGLYHVTRHEQYQNTLFVSKTPITDLENTVLRERFIRDTKLPIAVAESPYWEYFLELLDPFFSTITKFSQYLEAVNKCGGLDGYRKKIDDARTRILESMKSNSAYQDFLKADIKPQIPKRFGKVYTQENCNKIFISLDIISANFTAVKRYDSRIFKTNTWAELMGTGHPIIDENKHQRQMILGKLNAKKFAILYGNMTSELLKSISVLDPKIVSLQMDEIVFETSLDSLQAHWEGVMSILEKLGMQQDVKVAAFRLVNLPTHKPYFVKEVLDYKTLKVIKVDFKCIPPHHMAQCIKKYLGKEIVYEDRKYSYEGILATFDKPIFK